MVPKTRSPSSRFGKSSVPFMISESVALPPYALETIMISPWGAEITANCKEKYLYYLRNSITQLTLFESTNLNCLFIFVLAETTDLFFLVTRGFYGH